MAMGNKAIIAILICAIFGSSLIVTMAYAQTTIPTPSAPEFTLMYEDNSYYVPPTYGIDQYTGQNITIKNGYQVDNRTVVFKIKNHPFNSFTDSNGKNSTLSYNFRFKGHYGTEWAYYPLNGTSATHPYGNEFPNYSASNSNTTMISISLNVLNGNSVGQESIREGSQVDFQIQALIGDLSKERNPSTGWMDPSYLYTFYGEASSWSGTQTLNISKTPSASPSPSQTLNPSPSFTPTPSTTSTPTITPTLSPTQTPKLETLVQLQIIFKITLPQ